MINKILLLAIIISLSGCTSLLSMLGPSKPLVNASLDVQKGDRKYEAAISKKTINAKGGHVSGSNQQNFKDANDVNIRQGTSEFVLLVMMLIFGGISFILGCISVFMMVTKFGVTKENKRLRAHILECGNKHSIFN